MKKIFLIVFLINFNGYSQFSSANIVSSNINNLVSICSADIDGDGDNDIISISKQDFLSINNLLIWHENSDGNGTYNIQHNIINNNNDILKSVFVTDIDGDNRVDILIAYNYKVVWLKNLDGLGNFGTEQTIAYDDGITSVQAFDIDNDGDKDIIYSDIHSGSNIQWLKNLDGLGNFGVNQVLSSTAYPGPVNFSINDIDNDGDLDIVFSSYDEYFPNARELYSLKNNGDETFGTRQLISTNIDSPNDILTLDIDNDNDLDIIIASTGNDTIYYLENTDGLGNYGNMVVFANLNGPFSIVNFDFDNDGDQDIVAASLFDDKITLLKNEGSFQFSEINISENSDNAISVFTSDVDGDNLIDIISASVFDNTIAWYKNEVNLSVEDNKLVNLIVYPNPSSNLLKINSNVKLVKIKIFNYLGQSVKQIKNITGITEINISNLFDGVYFLKMESVDKKIIKKIIIKKKP